MNSKAFALIAAPHNPGPGTNAIAPTAILILAFLGILLLMFWAWKRKAKQEAKLLAEPKFLSEIEVAELKLEPVASGTYVSTVYNQAPLQRVHAYGLGTLAKAQLYLTKDLDLVVTRLNSSSFLIPRADLQGVKEYGGQAGKFMGFNKMLAVVWKLGNQTLQSGFQLDSSAEQNKLLTILNKELKGAA